MLLSYAVFSALIVVYGLFFGNAKMERLVQSWGLALVQTFGVEEPLLITLTQLVPYLMERLTSNEAFAQIVHELLSTGVGKAISSCFSIFR